MIRESRALVMVPNVELLLRPFAPGTKVVFGSSRVRMVGEVKRFRPELQIKSLADFRVLENREVYVDSSRSANIRQCPRNIAECEIGRIDELCRVKPSVPARTLKMRTGAS